MNPLFLENPQLELELIAYLLKDNKLFYSIHDRVSAEDFANREVAQLFESIATKLLNGENVNINTLRSQHPEILNNDNSIKILNATPTFPLTGEVLTIANGVRVLGRKRTLFSALQMASENIAADSLDSTVDSLQKVITEIYAAARHPKVETAAKVIGNVIEDMQRPTAVTTSTGFGQLDKAMSGGFERGKVYCFAARPKAGKSMMLGTISNNLRKRGVKFSVVAAEMGSKQIISRLMAAEAGTWVKGLNANHVPVMLKEAANSETMLMLDAPRIKLSALEAHVAMVVERYGIEGFVLDYMQLVAGRDAKTSSVEHLENVAQTVAELCKKYNVWCLTACQMNREESGARGGDGILMAVDWMYQIHKIEDSRPEVPKRFYLECLAIREGGELDIGDENRPYLTLAKYGTHFMEVE